MSSDKQSRDDSAPWGRVADDGTVYVRTADGERSVGTYEAGTPDEAVLIARLFTQEYQRTTRETNLGRVRETRDALVEQVQRRQGAQRL